MERPAYFETVRRKAAERWDQLEADPELAAPWHQLFRQVQSPRHVVSELLQNADDAGATRARVRIDDGTFIFEHNGEDFTDEHFASLCRFGYSNKRSLHTIGFRGIGFKSTFSLGNRVVLTTPTLSVHFERKRFTEPVWSLRTIARDGFTRIEVEIEDEHRRHELERNLDEWVESPISLLFFKSMRSFTVRDVKLQWESAGEGPVKGSEWVFLNKELDDPVLLVRSETRPFPEAALKEIANERLTPRGENLDYPPSRVEIVMGVKGVKGPLFVVLPTGVETSLPFACNAPFIQDPARLKIKDTETSFTNRWLLQRIGELAASTIKAWLSREDLPIAERAWAYDLMPNVDRRDASLEGTCATAVELAFERAIEGSDILLAESGALVPEGQCVVLPDPVLQVWDSDMCSSLFDNDARPPLSPDIAAENRVKLRNWALVDSIETEDIVRTLQLKSPPRPHTWRQLAVLWAFVEPFITRYGKPVDPARLHIFPIQGSNTLLRGQDVVRLGRRRLLQSDNDWQFLDQYLLVLNQNWTRFLSEERRRCRDEDIDGSYVKKVEKAHTVLRTSGFDETSDFDKIISRVATEFFSTDSVTIQDAVRLAQIAAKLNAKVRDSMRYFTRDGKLSDPGGVTLYDEDGGLERVLPDSYVESHLLHSAYSSSLTSCSFDDWRSWAQGDGSGLLRFPPLEERETRYKSKSSFEKRLASLLDVTKLQYPYKTESRYPYQRYIIIDYDFPEEVVSYWEKADSEAVWEEVIARVLSDRLSESANGFSLRLKQTNTKGTSTRVLHAPVIPTIWLRRFRDRECLPDTHGVMRRPADLLIRTADTEALLDVEPFVHISLDVSDNHRLLKALGVRDKPLGPTALLDRLRAFSRSNNPPTHEVEKWYRRLDQLVTGTSSEILHKVSHAFRSEELILTRDGSWHNSLGVFQKNSQDELPEIAIVRPAVADLRLWERIGVAALPTADHIIAWLKTLNTGQKLSGDEIKRVKSFLSRYAVRIWSECRQWVNLAGEWASIDGLEYGLSMQSMTAWGHLFEHIRKKTADFQVLGFSLLNEPPFVNLPSLASQLEHRMDDDARHSGRPKEAPWMKVFGEQLRRFKGTSEDETRRIRDLASRLARSSWTIDADVQVTPYLRGIPAGTPKKAEVAWIGEMVFSARLPSAKLARIVPEEIGKTFERPDIKAALAYSFERAPDDIRAYMEENFELAAEAPRPQLTVPDRSEVTVEPQTEIISPDSSPDDSQVDLWPPPSDPQPTPERDTTPKPRKPPGPRRPSLMEDYLALSGFAEKGDGLFSAPDGRRMRPPAGNSKWWEVLGQDGFVRERLFPLNASINDHSVELDADVWALIEQNPGIQSLLLRDTGGKPIQLPGKEVMEMLNSGTISIVASRYRIVWREQDTSK